MATTGASVKLKRLRQRFGIRAPKVAIKTHVAWYWHALATVAIASVTLAFAAWIFGAGKGFPGFQSGSSEQEIEALKLRVGELESELGKVRSVADSSESRISMERATQRQLVRQVGMLESENANLKQDLAFFESMGMVAAADGENGVNISRLRVEPESRSGQYRYRMLLVHKGGRQTKESRGALQLLVKVQQEGKDAMIAFPSEAERDSQQYRYEVRHFQRAEGVFSVPAGAVVKGVEVRLVQDGVVRARQSVIL
ncbi:MAG: hypothetical protein HY777_13155 [Betaproteobacteria bacterium]|nr:hypothetical protein [Betaproteobacteria bacterium]